MPPLSELIGSVLIVVSTLEVWAFVVLYHRRTRGRWRVSDTGRHLMTSNIVIGTVMALSSIRIIADVSNEVGWFLWLRIVVFVGVPIVFAGQLWLLWNKQQVRPRPDRAPMKGEPDE